MGAWGAGVFEDDLAADVRGYYEEEKETCSAREAGKKTLKYFKEVSEDEDEIVVLYLALYSLLWEDGKQIETVTKKVAEIVTQGLGLQR